MLILAITSTFQLRDMYTSWMYRVYKHLKIIDCAIVKRCDLHEVQITRAMRKAECSTNHCLIRSTLRLTVRQPARRQMSIRRLNVQAAHDQNTTEKLHNVIALCLCQAYQRLLHQSTPQTLLWNGMRLLQP